jgi:hypothetical protein
MLSAAHLTHPPDVADESKEETMDYEPGGDEGAADPWSG